MLVKLPKRVDPSDIEQLVDNIQKGNEDSRQQLINGYIRLVYAITSKFGRYYPQYQEELKAVAESNLVDKLEKIKKGKIRLVNYNIGAYINSSTVHALRNFITKQAKLALLEHDLWEELKDSLDLTFSPAVYNLYLNDILTSSTFTEIEKQIVKLKIEGYTDSEIATTCSVSQPHITTIKNGLKEKIRKFLDA